jgi:hypothetical protein
MEYGSLPGCVEWHEILEVLLYLRNNSLDPDEIIWPQRRGSKRAKSTRIGVKWLGGRWASLFPLPRSTGKWHVATFDSEDEAAAAYDIAMLSVYGDNALTNFPTQFYSDILSPEVRRLIWLGITHSYPEVRRGVVAIVRQKVRDLCELLGTR